MRGSLHASERTSLSRASAEVHHVCCDEPGAGGNKSDNHLGDFVRGGDMDVPRTVVNESAHLVGDPAGVGDGRVDDVRGDAVAGEFERSAQSEVFLRGFSRSVRDFFGKVAAASGCEADDAAPSLGERRAS